MSRGVAKSTQLLHATPRVLSVSSFRMLSRIHQQHIISACDLPLYKASSRVGGRCWLSPHSHAMSARVTGLAELAHSLLSNPRRSAASLLSENVRLISSCWPARLVFRKSPKITTHGRGPLSGCHLPNPNRERGAAGIWVWNLTANHVAMPAALSQSGSEDVSSSSPWLALRYTVVTLGFQTKYNR